jgi:hypothetical protein
MSNDCSNTLIVVDTKERPENFRESLEKALYGQILPQGEYCSVTFVEGNPTEFRFRSGWIPPMDALTAFSAEHKGETLLLRYSCWESGFRGQAVIENGGVIEHIHRYGYYGPGFLFADMTHPLVDLFLPYLEARTLAQDAAQRLQDAIEIVRGLKETLQDSRFTDSRFSAYRNHEQVSEVLARLTLLEEAMEHTASISFAGVLLEYSVLELGSTQPRDEMRKSAVDDPHEQS